MVVIIDSSNNFLRGLFMALTSESRILIVDDEPSIRILLSRKLHNDGYHCMEAYDFHSASTILNNFPLKLVITDINMPGGSGIELLTAIKRKWTATSVIMMTGDSKFNKTATDCIKIGAAEFITKPFDINKLARSVRQILSMTGEQTNGPVCA